MVLRVRSGVEAMEWSPDGRQLAVACADRRIYLWNVDAGQKLTLDAHQSVPKHLAFSPSGRTLASTGNDRTLRLWDCSLGGKPMVTLPSPPAVEQLVFGKDERQLAAVLVNGDIQFWEVAPAAECRALADPTPFGIADFDISPDGRWLACARLEGIGFWETATGRSLGSLALGDIRDVAFSPSGELFTSDLLGVNGFPSTHQQTARGIESQFGPGRSLGQPTQSRHLCCSADGKLLAVTWADHVKVLQTVDGSVRAVLPTGPGIGSVAISPDGRWVAGALEAGGELRVWESFASNQVISLPVGGRANGWRRGPSVTGGYGGRARGKKN
jgi:WD40 repeat protein